MRSQWRRQRDYSFCCLAYVVGLGNLWRFPYLVLTHGGGVFLVVYLICLTLIGLPLLLIELSLGQFTSADPLHCWEFCPIFQGLGLAMVVHMVLTQFPDSATMAWTFFFFTQSISYQLPWDPCRYQNRTKCLNEINQGRFRELVAGNMGEQECDSPNGTVIPTCLKRTFRPAAYFEDEVLGLSGEHSMANIGPIRAELALSLAAVWILIAYFTSLGVRFVGGMFYATVIITGTMSVILVSCGFFPSGWDVGVMYMLRVDLSSLGSLKMWVEAAAHAVYSLSVGKGGLLMFASYSRFKANVFRDVLTVAAWDTIIGFLATLWVSSCVGIFAHHLNMPVESVAVFSGPDLAFGVIPWSLTFFHYPSIISVLYFLAVFFVGIDVQILTVATLITLLLDYFPQLVKRGQALAAFMCLAFYLSALPIVTRGGKHLFDIYYHSLSYYPVATALVECLAISYCYGTSVFLSDITVMVGKELWGGKFTAVIINICWLCICPAVCLTGFVYCAFLESPFGNMLSWYLAGTISSFGAVIVLTAAVWDVHISPERQLSKKFRTTMRPSDKWGPALLQNYIAWARTIDSTPPTIDDLDINASDSQYDVHTPQTIASDRTYMELNSLDTVRSDLHKLRPLSSSPVRETVV